MNKIKSRFIILLGLCIFCLFIFLISQMFSRFSAQFQSNKAFNIQKNNIQELDFIWSNEKIVVLLKNKTWYVKTNPTVPADEQRIESIIGLVTNLEKKDIVSENKTKQKNFGIDSNRITIRTSHNVYDLYVGNADQTENYLRIGQDAVVFKAEGFDTVFDPFDYRDLRLHFVENEDQVNTVLLKWQEPALQFNKKNDQWTVNGQKAVREHMDYFINNIATLRATDIGTHDPHKLTPESNFLTIRLIENGHVKTLDAFSKDDTESYVRTSNSSFIFIVPIADLDALEKGEKDFTE